MKKILKSSLLISTALLLLSENTHPIFAMDKPDLAQLTVQGLPAHAKGSDQSLFQYLDTLKDGINDAIIEEAKRKYRAGGPGHLLKMKAAIEHLRIAQSTSSAVSSELTQKHEKKLSKVKTQLSLSEQKVQQVTQEKHHVERKAQEAEKRALEAEKKASEVADEFSHKMGTVVLELASIRYLAYQSPEIYRKTLEAIIKASEGINNLIIDYTKDIKHAKLIQYIRLPIVPRQELDAKERDLTNHFTEVHQYIKKIFPEIDNQLIPFQNRLNESKIEDFKDKYTDIEKIMDSLGNSGDIVKFLQNTQKMVDLAISIETLLGNAEQSIGNLYPERNGKRPEDAYKVCSHLYDLHDFITGEKQTKKFQGREDYFSGLSEPVLAPIQKPRNVTSMAALNKFREEYANAQTASVLTTLFGHSNIVSLTQLNQQVDAGNNVEQEINRLQKAAQSAYSGAYKKVVAEDHKSFVPAIYKVMREKFKDVKEKEITEEMKIVSNKLGDSETQLMNFLKRFDKTKGEALFNFTRSDSPAIVLFLEKGHEGLLNFVHDKMAFAQRLKDLSIIIDKMPPGNAYIKDLALKIQDALAKHDKFQEALRKLQSMPHNVTENLLHEEIGIPETIPNLR